MELKWKYLTAPLGTHWADQYINFKFLDKLFTTGHKNFGGKGANRWFPKLDPGLGDFRFATTSGNLRPLLSSSMKIEKSDGSAVFVRVLYLSPAKESDIPVSEAFPKSGWTFGKGTYKGVPVPKYRLNPDTCVAGDCEYACIITAGNMRYAARTRYAKTWYFFTEPVIFLRQILSEIAGYSHEAYLGDMLFYARLNGTSDIMWEYLIDMDAFTKDTKGMGGFYDYTKHPYGNRVKGNKKFPKYYHLTYSVDERLNRERFAGQYLEHGFGVSIVTPEKNVKKILKETANKPSMSFVVDGDITDFRFADPPRAVVLLKSKGALLKKKDDVDDLAHQDVPLCPIALGAQKRFGAEEQLMDVTMGGKYTKLDGMEISTKFPIAGIRKEGGFEQSYDEIMSLVEKIVAINKLEPIEGPVSLQKPFAIQEFKSIGISQRESNFFFDKADPFMDAQSYKDAQVGRFTYEEWQVEKERLKAEKERQDKAKRLQKKEREAELKRQKKAAAELEKERQLWEIASDYYNALDNDVKLSKAQHARDTGISVGKLNQALQMYPDKEMPLSPVLTDEMKSLLGTPKKRKKNPSKMQVLSSPDGDFLFILKGGNTVMKIGDQKTWFCEETLERDLNRMGFRLNEDWTVSKR